MFLLNNQSKRSERSDLRASLQHASGGGGGGGGDDLRLAAAFNPAARADKNHLHIVCKRSQAGCYSPLSLALSFIHSFIHSFFLSVCVKP
jgi:hypothetical protein